MEVLQLSRPQFDIVYSKSAINLFHSGQGAGKTFAMGTLSYSFAMYCPESFGFIGANTFTQLTQSTLLEIFSVWAKYFDCIEGRDYIKDKMPIPGFNTPKATLKSYKNTILFRNGALIFVGSLDNYKAHDGKTLGWAMLDETKDTKEEAVKDVILARLRQKGLYLHKEAKRSQMQFPYNNVPTPTAIQQNPLYIFTSPAKVEWLAEMFKLEKYRAEIKTEIFRPDSYFYLRTSSMCVVISSTHHNQHNLPPGYIENRLEILTEDKIEMNIYGSPFGKSGAEYYSAFSHERHVRPVKLDDSVPLHISFDFNVNPYMPATIWQVITPEKSGDGRMKVRAIHEIALEAPRNTIEDVCSQFRAEFGQYTKRGLFWYADATGKARLAIKDARTYHERVRKGLRDLLTPSSERLLSANVRHNAIGKQTLGRRDFMNACLKGAYGFDIEISPTCKYLVADLQFMKEDANGAKLKKKEKINGVDAEKYGHMSDSMDALFCFLFEKHWR